MRFDLKNGKTVITLHEADKRAFAKVRDMLHFVEINAPGEALETAADTARQVIDDVLQKLCSETPEDDTADANKDPALKKSA